jgi:hypothetical protein
MILIMVSVDLILLIAFTNELWYGKLRIKW